MFSVLPFESKTISWWYDQKKRIDLEPIYQRKGSIWSASDKAYLIDSILNDYDMPKIYIADFSFGNSKLISKEFRYALVDGKQRFEAMFDFYEDKIKLLQDFIYQEDTSIKISGMRFSEIRLRYPEIARKFENYNISIMRIITDEEGKINDLFVRLNTSKPLTGAELRSAMSGEAPMIIKKIAAHKFFDVVRFSKKRAQDQNAAAKVLLLEFIGGFVSTYKKDLDSLIDIAVRSETGLTGLQQAGKRVEDVFDRMHEVFVEKDPLFSSQGQITIYYWLIKNINWKDLKYVRDFLLSFEANRKMASEENLEEDGDKYDFYIYSQTARSVDSKRSLETRYAIISSYWKIYLEHKKHSANSI